MSNPRITKIIKDENFNLNITPAKAPEFLAACANNDIRAINAILDSKANIDGYDYVSEAVVFNSHDVLKLLLEYKIYSSLERALATAAHNNNTGALTLLLAEVAKSNITVPYIQTALILAGSQGKKEACQLLLNSKADPTQKNDSDFKKTAFDYVKQNGHEKITDLFKKHAVDAYKQEIGALNFGLDNKSDEIGINDQGEKMKNDLRSLRLFSKKNDRHIIQSILAPFLKPKF